MVVNIAHHHYHHLTDFLILTEVLDTLSALSEEHTHTQVSVYCLFGTSSLDTPPSSHTTTTTTTTKQFVIPVYYWSSLDAIIVVVIIIVVSVSACH